MALPSTIYKDVDIMFNRPSVEGKEVEYILDAVKKAHISGNGFYTKKCHQLLENELDVKKVLLTTNCTHALEMSAILLDIQPGDEVIVPTFTFVSTVNAFVLRGAKPVFIDSRPDTINLDEKLLEALITPLTKAIVVVHYAGVACEMDAILEIAKRHKIPVVEDNAHGLFGKYKGKHLGTFGVLATQSFHETKNFSCGEGGALLVNDPNFVFRAEIIWEKGTNRSQFFRGEVDKYTWVDVGSSWLPSDVLAAHLYAQLEVRDDIQAKRCHIWTRYNRELKEWAAKSGIACPTVPEHCEQTFHMFYLLFPNFEQAQNFRKHLRHMGILACSHYVPLHASDMGIKFGAKLEDCPVSNHIADCLIRLPFFNSLTDLQQSRVISVTLQFSINSKQE